MATDDLRTYFTSIYMMPLAPGIEPLPVEMHPAPWLHILDVPRFIALHLARLDSECPRLRMLAERNLKALHRSLNESHT